MVYSRKAKGQDSRPCRDESLAGRSAFNPFTRRYEIPFPTEDREVRKRALDRVGHTIEQSYEDFLHSFLDPGTEELLHRIRIEVRMELRKTSDSGTKMVIEWDAVPDASAGYRGREKGAPKWTQTQGTKMTFRSGAEVEVQALGVVDRGSYPTSEPEPGDYTYRFATFDPATDNITGTLNRANGNGPTPAYNWWIPGTAFPPAGWSLWPDGGGIWPISSPYGPGFKLRIIAGDMDYGYGNTRIARWVFGDAGNPIAITIPGATHIWEWTWMRPGGHTWPQGVLLEGLSVNWHASDSPSGTVGSHFYLDNGWQQGGPFHYYAAAQQYGGAPGTGAWTRIHCSIPFNADEYHTIRWEIKYSTGGDGYMRASTSVNGGAFQQWCNYSGRTTPDGVYEPYVYFNVRPPAAGGPLELHWLNQRLTIL